MMCNICGDKGFVLYFQHVDHLNPETKYEFISHCNCVKGSEYAYDGRTVKDRESRYYIPNVMNIFGGTNPFEEPSINITAAEAIEKMKEFFKHTPEVRR